MLSEREKKQLRLERLTAMLKQANEALAGCGQYIEANDPNRKVLEEIVQSNNVVLSQEYDALHEDSLKYPSIITID